MLFVALHDRSARAALPLCDRFGTTAVYRLSVSLWVFHDIDLWLANIISRWFVALEPSGAVSTGWAEARGSRSVPADRDFS